MFSRRTIDVGDDCSLQARYMLERLSVSTKLGIDPWISMTSCRHDGRYVRFFDADRIPPLFLMHLWNNLLLQLERHHRVHINNHGRFVSYNPQRSIKRKNSGSFVEQAERVNYQSRMSTTWNDESQPISAGLHTEGNVTNPYLTEAPYDVIVLMKQVQGSNGERYYYYYFAENSCGILAGMSCAALHNANLATWCSTPMHAEEHIRKLLERPDNERVFALMPDGYPSKECTVPYRDDTTVRKGMDKIMKVY